MVVGSPGIVADTSYDVINMTPIIIIASIGDFFVVSLSVKKLILH